MTSQHPADGVVRHRTSRERAETGKAARAAVPRSNHAEFAPAQKRPDPVDVIEAQSATRLPELVPIRCRRMTESPFRFCRGAAAIMAGDLADTPRTGITTQVCGDAHLLNFRLPASPERRMMFDIHDFDETPPGPWEWDVKRLCTSFVVAGRANAFSAKERACVVRSTVRSYREWRRRFAELGNLPVWYARFDEDWVRTHVFQEVRARASARWSRSVSKARTRDKGIAEPEPMVPDGKRAFGEPCGATLARAHARSGDRIAIAAYLGGGEVFDRAPVTFTERCAGQNEQDHRALVDAVRSGRVKAETA
jgi:hypothetical protein